MKDWNKSINQQKHQFKGKEYCVNCQQRKSCGLLEEKQEYCCACYQKLLEELEQEELLVSEAWQMLNDYRERVIICHCWEAEKTRVNYLNADGNGWIRCESKRCKKRIESAGHHGVIKNRNDVKFWGIKSEFRVLCLGCIGKKYYDEMVEWQRKKFREYVRRGYV